MSRFKPQMTAPCRAEGLRSRLTSCGGLDSERVFARRGSVDRNGHESSTAKAVLLYSLFSRCIRALAGHHVGYCMEAAALSVILYSVFVINGDETPVSYIFKLFRMLVIYGSPFRVLPLCIEMTRLFR